MKLKLSLLAIIVVSTLTYSFSQTTISLQPDAIKGKDSEIGSIVPNNNYADSPKLTPYAWTQQSIVNIVRPLVEFDLSSIPANAVITDAKLSFYFNSNYGKQHEGSNAFVVKRITSAWEENTVTWNNQPSTVSTNQVNINQSATTIQDYKDIDVKLLVQDMIADPQNSHGFMLQLQNESPYAAAILASSDNVNSALHPKLVLTYYLPTEECLSLQPDAIKGKDSEIGSIVPNNNYADSPKLTPYAWTQQSIVNIVRPLVEFDLSSIPANAVITDAKLSFYFNSNYGKQHEGSNAFVVKRITSAWEENTVTWNNQPSTVSTNQVNINQSATTIQDYKDIDVKLLVQDMIADPQNSHGFMLQLQNESPYAAAILASSDNVNSALHPKLNICYSFNTGINQKSLQETNISIFPNPFSSYTTIVMPLDFENKGLNIICYDMMGRIVNQITFPVSTNNQYVFDKGNLSEGSYFYKLNNGDESIKTGKFFIAY